MLFNSIDFAIFLPIVFVLYWFVTSHKLKTQNALLLLASYVFYGWWDWKFLLLIAFSSFVDYSVGKKMSTTKDIKQKKALLLISLIVNLGFLFFFKYFNFFTESFATSFTFFGQSFEPLRLSIILPVGISFYTFQTLSYSIDVYKGRIEADNDIISFFAYVSFFPQLVAGPIERASNLLPQFHKKRIFEQNKAIDGLRQILWGLFKKMVIADNCAQFANEIFATPSSFSGSTLLLGAFFFAFQIYGDFSGYSDIAIGTARLFGFHLMQNFAFPYFSRDIAEFWRRWHISLSTWFRDYVYIPLGGSRGGTWMKVRNTFVIFLLSGFWHGANWTFVMWGLINAFYFLPLLLLNRNRRNTNTAGEEHLLPSLKELLQIGTTFFFTLIAWIFFRAKSIYEAFDYMGLMFSKSLFSVPEIFPKKILLIVFLFICVEWFQRNQQHALEFNHIKLPSFIRWGLYYTLLFLIIVLGDSQQEFIYFQF